MSHQPKWTEYPDYIVIRTAPDILDVGGIEGSWLDRRKTPFLEIALQAYNLKLTPSDKMEMSENGEIAQIFMLEKLN